MTAFSMLPVIVIAYRYGFRWGLLSGMTYGVLQLLTGLKSLSGVSVITFIGAVFLDYLLAFGACSLGGLFRSVKNQSVGMVLGALAACVCRFIFHYVAGILLWGAYADGVPVWIYSLTYNGVYMSVETIMTVVGAFLLCLFLNFRSADITKRAE